MNKLTPDPKVFIKAQFRVPANLADEAASILAVRGALGCAAKWPHKIKASPKTPVILEAFFTHLPAAQLESLNRALASAGMLHACANAPKLSRIIDPGWAAMWKERFEPLPIGRRLEIVPPWHPARRNGRLPIVIDPGQGFGTGHHPTTRGTLIALEAECGKRRFREGLDVGTGSGVLAFAMVRLGVERVVALDNDCQALDNARHNAALNRIDGAIRFSQARLRALRRTFPLITANILSSTLIELAPELIRLLAPDGRLILSGILAREANRVMSHYRPQTRRLWSRTDRGWTTLILGAGARR